jgi:hypothetical protein
MSTEREVWNEGLLAARLLAAGTEDFGDPEGVLKRRFGLSASFLSDSRQPGLFAVEADIGRTWADK